jgi:hypothetical protein
MSSFSQHLVMTQRMSRVLEMFRSQEKISLERLLVYLGGSFHVFLM